MNLVRKLKYAAWVGLTVLAPLAATSANAQVSGAIFTTNGDEVPVNMNIYPAKSAVYLNGGPRTENGSLLTDGTYYYQVTAPNGMLLSTDDASCRQVQVTAGRFAGPVDVGGCQHAAGPTSTNGGIGVQLIPYDDTPNAGGEYKVWLISQEPGCVTSVTANIIKFKNSCTKTDNFKVEVEDDGGQCTTCGTDTSRLIGGVKYYDANANGIWEMETEVPVPGVVINVFLSGSDLADFTMPTDPSGAWVQQLTVGSPFKVCEVMPLGTWRQTGPLLGAQTTTAIAVEGVCWEGVATSNDIALDFGNLCLGAGNGHTLGFWQNKNGQALITATHIAALVGYNLKNANGSNFDPASKAALGKWLTQGSATNMANMLSVQLAAMYLNTTALPSPASTSALIYAPGTVSANALGYATLSAVMAEANASLAANPVTVAASAARDLQTALKNALDAGNNNLNFVQATACAVEYPVVQ